MPTREELATWAKNYVELWNAGEKEAWIENWKKLCYGDFKMYDPVGTPPKFDFVGCCLERHDLFQPCMQEWQLASGVSEAESLLSLAAKDACSPAAVRLLLDLGADPNGELVPRLLDDSLPMCGM